MYIRSEFRRFEIVCLHKIEKNSNQIHKRPEFQMSASWKEPKIIKKDYLYKWLIHEVTSFYELGKDPRKFGGNQRVVRLVKYLKLLPNGDFLVQLCDSTHSVLGLITSECISDFERLNKNRVTEVIKRDCLILIRQLEIKWVARRQFFSELYEDSSLVLGSGGYDVFTFGVIKIGDLELFDSNDNSMMNSKRVELIYDTHEYNSKVKPLQIID